MGNEKKVEINTQVNKLKNLITDYNKEIIDLQDNCVHPKSERSLKNSNGSIEPIIIICDICQKRMGTPNKEDVEKFLHLK